MKFFLLVISALAVNCLPTANDQWNEFKVKFEKQYDKIEELSRFQIFQDNLAKIAEHNARFDRGEVTYKIGVNQFTDLTHEEYLSMLNYNKAIKPPHPENIKYMEIPEGGFADLPDSIDWRQKNVVTPVKNQGPCGACWAFSTTGGLEGQYAIKYGNLVSLSEQNLIDCSIPYGNGDCATGGVMIRGLNYVKDYGINSEDVYPYEAELKDCRYRADQSVLHISGYEQIQQDEQALKYAVATYGPISVAIDFSLAGGYVSGIFNNPACHNKPDELNHGVLVVGYGTENGLDYWIVKNSWSANFGEQGYIRMIRNANNQCGIVDDASRALVL